MNIRPVVAEQTDGHDEANSRFSQFCQNVTNQTDIHENLTWGKLATIRFGIFYLHLRYLKLSMLKYTNL